MPTDCTRQRASTLCPLDCGYRHETPEGRIRCHSPDKQRGRQTDSLPRSTSVCSHPRCRRPAEVIVCEDSKTRLASPECIERGYCERHEAERLEAAQRIFETAHSAEIEAAKIK